MHRDSDDKDYYYAHDHLYSVVALIDDGGNVVERYEYDAYGKAHILSSAYSVLSSAQYGNPYFFTGRRLDELDNGNFEIYYYRARYYDTYMARFYQPDPLGYVDGLNLYEYVVGNPVAHTDPLGLVKAEIEIVWHIEGTEGWYYSLFGQNSILVVLDVDSEDRCVFSGKPKQPIRTQTHRKLWSEI